MYVSSTKNVRHRLILVPLLSRMLFECVDTHLCLYSGTDVHFLAYIHKLIPNTFYRGSTMHTVYATDVGAHVLHRPGQRLSGFSQVLSR